MSNENNETMHDLVVKPALVAASGTVLSLGVISGGTKMYNMPAPIVFGLTLGASSFASGLMKETVTENVLGDDSAELLYAATSPIITGGAAIGLYYAMTGTVSMQSGTQMFALGAISEMAGTYIDNNMLGDAIDF